ncbi:hypothetical protein VTO73DRAFT_6381 [Trametes versicolor]
MASYNPYTNRPAVSDSPAPPLGSKDPLFGFLPRKVTSEQALKAMESDINPFSKKPHSAQYKKILQDRKKLPVFSQMDQFLKMVSRPPGQS